MSIVDVSVRSGLRRGWIEFRNSLRAPEDLMYYVLLNGILAVVLYLNRDNMIEDADISVAHFIVPNALAMVVVFGAAYGLATVVVTEREDGTLLRAKSVPRGMRGYVVGQSARVTYETIFGSAIILIAATALIDGLWDRGIVGFLGVVALIVLGLLACAPIGFVLGSIFKNPRSVGGWGMVVIGALVYASGIFSTGGLPRWVEIIGQLFPLHWLAAAMRAALLPDWAATLEPGGEWRVWQAVAVLSVWSVIGLVLAPRLLQRMARRESGSAVAQRRDKALTRV